MGEDRRLKVAKRQLLLAQIARREARLALANAIAEEERSAAIHERASSLLSEYAKRSGEATPVQLGQSLTSDLAFIRSLQTMSDNAAHAHQDTREQAEFQMRALAAAETKLGAYEERVAGEKRALADLKARREIAPELTGTAKVARKLHKVSASKDQAAAKAAFDPETPQPPALNKGA